MKVVKLMEEEWAISEDFMYIPIVIPQVEYRRLRILNVEPFFLKYKGWNANVIMFATWVHGG